MNIKVRVNSRRVNVVTLYIEEGHRMLHYNVGCNINKHRY